MTDWALASLRAAAGEQRRRFSGRNVVVRHGGAVHAGAPREWIGGAEVIAPICHVGHDTLDPNAMSPTYAAVTCRRCDRVLSRGQAPAGWVGGPQQEPLFHLPVQRTTAQRMMALPRPSLV